jgi:SWIM zinc finger
MATTVSQPVPSAQAHTLADLGFEDADTLRWQYVCKEVAQRLTSLPHGRFSYMTLERVRQALDLAQRGCVSLSEDPNDLSAEVRSGSAHYQVHMGAGTCQCSDYQKRKTTCKHQLAVDIHLGALAQFDHSAEAQEAAADTAPGKEPVAEQPTPIAAPHPNPEPPAAAVAPAAPSTAQWPTSEAPASMNVKLRVG